MKLLTIFSILLFSLFCLSCLTSNKTKIYGTPGSNKTSEYATVTNYSLQVKNDLDLDPDLKYTISFTKGSFDRALIKLKKILPKTILVELVPEKAVLNEGFHAKKMNLDAILIWLCEFSDLKFAIEKDKITFSNKIK